MQKSFACLDYSPGTIAPRGILSLFTFLAIAPYVHPAMTFPFPLLPLLSDTIRTDFGSLVHRYACLLVLQRCIFQFAAQMNVRRHATFQRRLINLLVKIVF